MENLTVLDNSHKSIFSLLFVMQKLDDIIRVNLKRLIDVHAGGNQRQFARLVGIDYGLLNQIVNEHKDLGKPLMERICRALNIKYWELTVEPDSPFITDLDELQCLTEFRILKKYNKVDQVRTFIQYVISKGEEEVEEKTASVQEEAGGKGTA